MGGTYTLLVRFADDTLAVGALGDRALDAGTYWYVGSARGPGGFARLDRHREVAAGERDVRHWHVDYLLGHPAATVAGDVRSHGADVECAVAAHLRERGSPVPGFGASDCDCASHLVCAPGDADPLGMARRAHDAATGGPGRGNSA